MLYTLWPIAKLEHVGIKVSDYQRICLRLTGKAGQPSKKFPNIGNLPEPCVVVGIDPALRHTGIGIVKIDPKTTSFTILHQSVLRPPSPKDRLSSIAWLYEQLDRLLHEYRPNLAVIESLVYVQNMKTAFILGEVRGCILTCLARNGVIIHEITPRKMKLAITGYGGATKSAVVKMITQLLKLQSFPPEDVADALGLAIAGYLELRHATLYGAI